MNKEEYFLEKYLKPCAGVNKQFPLEIGDDCAVISLSEDLLISSDNSVVDVHFPNTFDPYFIAYRSVAICSIRYYCNGCLPRRLFA